LHTPDINADGTLTVPSVPGNGCEPNEKQLEKYRVA